MEKKPRTIRFAVHIVQCARNSHCKYWQERVEAILSLHRCTNVFLKVFLNKITPKIHVDNWKILTKLLSKSSLMTTWSIKSLIIAHSNNNKFLTSKIIHSQFWQILWHSKIWSVEICSQKTIVREQSIHTFVIICQQMKKFILGQVNIILA